MDGTFGVAGPGVVPGKVPKISVLCFAPIVAYTLGLPISEELPCVESGEFQSALEAIFEPEHLRNNPARYVAS